MDLNSAASDILHQMRRAGDVGCHTNIPKQEATVSKKRSRPEDKLLSEINVSKRQKNPRLEDIPEKPTTRFLSEDCLSKELFLRKGIGFSDRAIVRPTHVSIFQPLEQEQSFTPDQSRPLPKWMLQLPSSRVNNSVFRRPSVPVYLPSQWKTLDEEKLVARYVSTEASVVPFERSPSPHNTSLARLATTQESPEPGLPNQRTQSVPGWSTISQKPLAAFPFFQNPRAPLTPAIESSWGNAPSSGMTPYKGIPSTIEKQTPSPKGGRKEVLQSNEYNEKYSIQMSQNDSRTNKICPICEEILTNATDNDVFEWQRRLSRQGATGDIVMGLNGHAYHITCLQCRACRQPFCSKDSMKDWTWVGSSSPYHRTCMVQGAKPMLERLRQRLSMAGLTTGHAARQDHGPQMLPGLLRPGPHVLQQTRPGNGIVPTSKKPDYLKSLPSLFSIRAGPEPCASCGHALLATERVPGPNMTKHHVACLSACVQCGMDFEGKGTKWYAYGRRGFVRALCHECWVAGRDKNRIESR